MTAESDLFSSAPEDLKAFGYSERSCEETVQSYRPDETLKQDETTEANSEVMHVLEVHAEVHDEEAKDLPEQTEVLTTEDDSDTCNYESRCQNGEGIAVNRLIQAVQSSANDAADISAKIASIDMNKTMSFDEEFLSNTVLNEVTPKANTEQSLNEGMPQRIHLITPSESFESGSVDNFNSPIDPDNRARTPEPTDSEVSLVPDEEEEDEAQAGFANRPTTEGFLHTYAATQFDRASMNSSSSSIYAKNNTGCQRRRYSFYQGKNAFESLINSSAERVLEKIKTRTIDLEPIDLHSLRKMAPPGAPRTPPLVPSKARPRKLEPIRTLSTDVQNSEVFGAPLLTPLPLAK